MNLLSALSIVTFAARFKNVSFFLQDKGHNPIAAANPGRALPFADRGFEPHLLGQARLRRRQGRGESPRCSFTLVLQVLQR